ncbi:MAG: hypothetical protein VYE15_04355, partial [Myxococcota bacterium]|nr:hypothetical protein [Myxococcota bacterium]
EQRKEQRRRELEEERYQRQKSRESAEREALKRRARAAERESAAQWGAVSDDDTYDYEEEDDGLVGGLAESDSWSVDDGEEPQLGDYGDVEERPVRTSAYDSSGYGSRDDGATSSIVAPDPVIARQQSPRAGRPWYQQWWVWTAAGVVIAGATASAMITLSGGDEDPGFRATVSW